MDYVVVTGLVVAVSAVLLLNISSGTSEAATDTSAGAARSGDVYNSTSNTGQGERSVGGRGWTNEPSQGGGGGGSEGSNGGSSDGGSFGSSAPAGGRDSDAAGGDAGQDKGAGGDVRDSGDSDG